MLIKHINKYWTLCKSIFNGNKPSYLATFTVCIKEDGNPQFTFSESLTPEMAATLIARLSTLVDAVDIVKELERNGYKDIQHRLTQTSEKCLEKILESYFGSDSTKEQSSATTPPVDIVDERPLIDALGNRLE